MVCVGFVTPVSVEVAGRLGKIGYTSLLRDGMSAHVLCGTLALVQQGSFCHASGVGAERVRLGM